MMVERLRTGCESLGIALSGTQIERFAAYDAMLVEANERLDLTAVLEPAEVVDRHYLDSLAPLRLDGMIPHGARMIDVGTGAGFPGIPLAIVRPDLSLTLLDALQKRVAFLQRVVEILGLNAVAVHARAEDAARLPEHRERYDVAVSRAVTALPALLELTLPFVRVGGRMLAWKGPGVAKELEQGERAAARLGGELLPPVLTPVPRRDWQHLLVVAEKHGQTVRQYPRKAGEPVRKPLGRLS